MSNVKGRAEVHDKEREFVIVLDVHVRGYGKERHVEDAVQCVRKELGLEFDQVMVSVQHVLIGEELEAYDNAHPQ